MALIKCPECGKQISDRAEHCIGCGYRLENPHQQTSIHVHYDEKQRINDDESENKGIATVSLILGGVAMIFDFLFPIVGFPLSIVGLILAISARSKSNPKESRMSNAGMMLNVGALLGSILFGLGRFIGGGGFLFFS